MPNEVPALTEESTTESGAGGSEGGGIKLKDRAIEMVKSGMAREARGPEYALRLGVVGGGCSGFSYTMSFDNERKPDDTVIETADGKVVIDSQPSLILP